MDPKTENDDVRALCDDDDLLRVLRDPLVWEAPEFEATRAVASLFATVEAENDAAAALCASTLTGPSSGWAERLRNTQGTRTAAMVQHLLERVPALVTRRPVDALELTSIAMATADMLDPRDYWPDHVMEMRAHALRDHASVLIFLRRDTEAMKYVEQAELIFAQLPCASFETARLWLVKASVLRAQERYEEAIALSREAAATFLEYEDRPRYVHARISEAALLYDSGALERALELWLSIKDDPALEIAARPRVARHIATCRFRLGRRAEAAGTTAPVGTV